MLKRIVKGLGEMFFDYNGRTAAFPFVRTNGVFLNFPILFLSLGIADPRAFRAMREKKLSWLMLGLAVTVLVITAFDVMWSPYLLERYRMDVYFLMGILCFLAVGLWYESADRWTRRGIVALSAVMSAATVISAFLLYLCRVNVSYPDRVSVIAAALGLG